MMETRFAPYAARGLLVLPDPNAAKCLIDYLEHPTPRVRYAALAALYDTDRDVSGTFQSVKMLLGDADESVRRVAVILLRRMKKQSNECLDQVRKLLEDTHEEVRVAACGTLLLFGDKPAERISLLIESTNSNNRSAQLEALNSLRFARTRLDAVMSS
jgi:HEAT repeat protein